ncbi:EF hand family protein [Cryptosporidium andersoni]|uniref:EF hand family protein n=1 Tax=Cryptosporidium andersoni TaxID=117008 RepID=A0A1J4MA54_9CRYT|nr:EF hand family protein [Cryptosporidium andersoni]
MENLCNSLMAKFDTSSPVRNWVEQKYEKNLGNYIDTSIESISPGLHTPAKITYYSIPHKNEDYLKLSSAYNSGYNLINGEFSGLRTFQVTNKDLNTQLKDNYIPVKCTTNWIGNSSLRKEFDSSISNMYMQYPEYKINPSKSNFIEDYNNFRTNPSIYTHQPLAPTYLTQDKNNIMQVDLKNKNSKTKWNKWSSYSKLLPSVISELGIQDEYNKLSDIFNKYSNTVRGFMSNSEFYRFMEDVNIIEIGYRGVLFNIMDRNQDNYLTEIEFLSGMLVFRPCNIKQDLTMSFGKLRLQFIFFYYDSNRDGVLSDHELAKIIEHISIIKATINNGNNKPKKNQISSNKSLDLSNKILKGYIKKNYCSYDDFFILVQNCILNGTENLLRCRNDIFQSLDEISRSHNKSQVYYNYTGNSRFCPDILLNPDIKSEVNPLENIKYSKKGSTGTFIHTPVINEMLPSSSTYNKYINSDTMVDRSNCIQNIYNGNKFNVGSYMSPPNNQHINLKRELENNPTILSPINMKYYQNLNSTNETRKATTLDNLSNNRLSCESSAASPSYYIPSEGRTNIPFSPAKY